MSRSSLTLIAVSVTNRSPPGLRSVGGCGPASRLKCRRIELAKPDWHIDGMSHIRSSLDRLEHGRPFDREYARPATVQQPQEPEGAEDGGASSGQCESGPLVHRKRLDAPIGRQQAEPELGRADPPDHRPVRRSTPKRFSASTSTRSLIVNSVVVLSVPVIESTLAGRPPFSESDLADGGVRVPWPDQYREDPLRRGGDDLAVSVARTLAPAIPPCVGRARIGPGRRLSFVRRRPGVA